MADLKAEIIFFNVFEKISTDLFRSVYINIIFTNIFSNCLMMIVRQFQQSVLIAFGICLKSQHQYIQTPAHKSKVSRGSIYRFNF